VPLLYHPKDSRKENILVLIPGTQRKEDLVLNDVLKVEIDTAERAIRTDDWQLGYSVTVHSSHGLTIHNPQKVWIIDDYLQWSNLAYLAVSRVEYMQQLERVIFSPEESSVEKPPMSEQRLRQIIGKKLTGHKQQDENNGRQGFDLKTNYVLRLKEEQKNKFAGCGVEMLWSYAPKDTQQFSIDRFDNSKAHCMGECAADLFGVQPTKRNSSSFYRALAGGSCVFGGTTNSSSRSNQRLGPSD